MTDTRRASSLSSPSSVLAARYWTLAHGVNRLYAEEHGYRLEYHVHDNKTYLRNRKVGWAKLRVVIQQLRARGPVECAYGVSIDTDAYLRTSEPLAAVIHHYGLDADKSILFSREHEVEVKAEPTFANGGFFIVRNSEVGLALLQEWYDVPERHSDMAQFMIDDPQGLNKCWDRKVHRRHA